MPELTPLKRDGIYRKGVVAPECVGLIPCRSLLEIRADAQLTALLRGQELLPPSNRHSAPSPNGVPPPAPFLRRSAPGAANAADRDLVLSSIVSSGTAHPRVLPS